MDDKNLSCSRLFKSQLLRNVWFIVSITLCITLAATVLVSSQNQVFADGTVKGSSQEKITLGVKHSCAITSTGGVKCWGANDYGQMPYGGTLRPADIINSGSGVLAITSGDYHSCVLFINGSVKCWGRNNHGQIGDGSTSTSRGITNVTGLGSGVQAIAAGANHTCALLTTGGVKCWGSNSDGQIGDKTSGTDRLVPTDVNGLGSGVQAITAGTYHTCAILTTGDAKCWGANSASQLGDGTSTTRLVPTSVTGLGSGVQAITAGEYHTCALSTTGGVKCWGNNAYGQLGTGSINFYAPHDVTNLTNGVLAIDAGSDHTCAVLISGSVACWGYNFYGQLGNGNTSNKNTPVSVSGLSNVQAIAAGGDHTCALLTNGGVKCWGSNYGGQVGDGSITDRSTPVNIEMLGYLPGTVIAHAPSGVVPVLTSDWNSNVASTPQSGEQDIGLVSSGYRVAAFRVSFSEDRDWTGLSAGSSTNKAFMHYGSKFSDIPGAVSSSFTLYVPKANGTSVRICPGATTMSDVNLKCAGGYYLNEGETKYGATATVKLESDGITYWEISGLTGTGGMSVITGGIKDTMTRQAVNAGADHAITFGTNYGLTASGQTLTIKFDPDDHSFDLSNILVSDIELTDANSTVYTLGSSAGVNTWGVNINTTNDTITFTAPTSGTGYIAGATQVFIKIGTNAGGTHQIVNPASAGSYREQLTLNSANPEQGEVAIPIVDSDQVNVTGFVNTFINFDIDIGSTDTDCAYNTCLNHSGGTSATNYVVDLGELNSTWVNKSEDVSVMHSDGNNGTMNSIYFDLSTNAYNGAVVYVTSANGGLQGPANNIIPSLGYDGYTITANSGRYGYNVPATFPTSNGGSIYLNEACANTMNYCGFTTTTKELFSTNERPMADGRVRMDIAAAANYTNNPGSYTDTLTFNVVATY